ncbi:MAG: prenyltransferase [Spirochaetes bacterium]|jgi:1,4-dihydroxy-2-naphthoate octaprenyltransferase|nr:prenyltransferase [Spirochaetota bacterium]
MELVSARFSDILNVVELRTKIISVWSFSLGTAFAAYESGEFSFPIALLMVVAVLGVDMGTTAFNSYFDVRRGVDSRRFNREHDKVLVHSGLSSGFALLVAMGCFTVAAAFGLAVIIIVGTEVLLVGVVSMAVGFLYNGGPLPISSTPFGELFAGGFLGGVLFVLSYYVQTDALTPEALRAGIPLLLFVSSILAVNNTCDREGDGGAHRRTFAVIFGRRASEALVYLLATAAHAVLFASAIGDGGFPEATIVAAVVSYVFFFFEFTRMHRRGYSHETKGVSMKAISRAFIVFSMMTLASLLAGMAA